MNKFKRLFFVILTLSVLALSLPIAANASSDTHSFSDTYDYFAEKYQNLAGKEHVFKTAEYYQFYNYFLGGTDLKALYGDTPNATVQPSSGKYVFLLGGAWSDALKAAIGYVNEVAKEYGITAIYNFDPKLDGKSLDISSDPVYANKYNAILAKLGVDSLSFPSLIVYEKDSATTGHIVSSYSWSNTSFSSQAEIDSFKSALRNSVFNPAAVNGKIENIEVSDSDYFRSVVNARYYSFAAGRDNSDGTDYKKTLRPLPEDKQNVFEIVTLDELRGILASEGNYAVLLGGLWCHNTWATIPLIQEYAEKYHISKVYFYDTVLDSSGSSTNGSDQLQTRSSTYRPTGSSSNQPSPIAHLYVDLINDFLPNIYTLNQGEYDANIAAYAAAGLDAPSLSNKFISYQDSSGETVTARRVQLPNFFVYNKDNKTEDGTPAPVIGQVEIMTELWFTSSASPDYNKDTSNQNGGYPIGTTTQPYPVADYYTKGYNRELAIKITSGTSSSGTTYSNANPFNYTHSYWAPGLNQILGAFISRQLSELISQAEQLNQSDYTSASYEALKTALNSAKSLKSSIDSAVKAQSPDSLVPDGSAILQAYTTLLQSLESLETAKPGTTNGTQTAISQTTRTTLPSAASPKTGENTATVVLVFLLSTSLICAVALIWGLQRKGFQGKIE